MQHGIYSAETCFTGRLVDQLTVFVKDCAVGEPWRSGWEGGLDEDGHKVDPPQAPHEGHECSSSLLADGQVEGEEKREGEMHQIRYGGNDVEKRVRQMGEYSVRVAEEESPFHLGENYVVRL